MFTRADFLKTEPNLLRGHHYRGLYFTTFGQFSFNVSDSEETIRIARAPKEAGDNGLKFWLAAVSLGDWREHNRTMFRPYLENSAFKPITEAEFSELVAAQCLSLIVPPTLPLHNADRFIGALLMRSLATEFIVDLFAEYEDEYIHFYWDTTS